MTLLTDVKTFLSDAPIQAIVDTRVYPLELPKPGSYPALVYNVIDAPPLSSSHDGADSTEKPRVQVTCWARDILVCEQLSKLVVTALKTHVGERDLEVIDYGRLDNEPAENAFAWIMDFRWPRRYDV